MELRLNLKKSQEYDRKQFQPLREFKFEKFTVELGIRPRSSQRFAFASFLKIRLLRTVLLTTYDDRLCPLLCALTILAGALSS